MNKQATINKQVLFYIAGFIILAFAMGWFQMGSVFNLPSSDVEKTSIVTQNSENLILSHKGIWNTPDTIYINAGDEPSFYFNIEYADVGVMIAENGADGSNYDEYKPQYEWLNNIEGKSYPFYEAYLNGEEMQNVQGNCRVQINRRAGNIDYGSYMSQNFYITLSCQGNGLIDYDANTQGEAFSVSSVKAVIEIPKDGVITISSTPSDTSDSTSDTPDTTPSTEPQELSFIDKINLWIQSVINSITGVFS